METVEAIEEAVKHLSESELAKFRAWFAQFDSDAWDAQIERDAVAGKFDALADQALAEYHAGKSREI